MTMPLLTTVTSDTQTITRVLQACRQRFAVDYSFISPLLPSKEIDAAMAHYEKAITLIESRLRAMGAEFITVISGNLTPARTSTNYMFLVSVIENSSIYRENLRCLDDPAAAEIVDEHLAATQCVKAALSEILKSSTSPATAGGTSGTNTCASTGGTKV